MNNEEEEKPPLWKGKGYGGNSREMRPNNICCMFVGKYTGVPACSVIAYKCPEVRVTILDDEETIAILNSDNIPNCNTEFEQIITKCRNRNLYFSSNYSSVIKDADMIFISISDSSKAMGMSEGNGSILKQLEEAVKLISVHAKSDTIVVENSRIPIKAAERISTLLPPPRQSGVRFLVISSPEFLNEGSTLNDLLNPEKVLIGCHNNPMHREAAQSLCELYENWIPRKNILIVNEHSAELSKFAGSAFLAQRISNMSSLSELCEYTDADISEVADILEKDSRTGLKSLHSSPGFGLFQKEILSFVSLCQSLKLVEVANYWQAVIDMNEYQKSRCFRKIESAIGPPRDKEIAIWGFAYEKNSSDTKNSLAMEVCRWLLSEGSKIKIYDPKVPAKQILEDMHLNAEEEHLKICTDAYDACANTSAVIICTDWDDFARLDYTRVAKEMAVPLIVDGKKFLRKEDMNECCIDLRSVGLNYVYM